MKKVLITLPNSIAGTLILKGFAQGFKSNGCIVLTKDLRDLTINEIEKFNPDIIFGYDYGFLFYDNEKLNSYIIKNQKKFKLVHYFADEPKGNFACVGKPQLYVEFPKINTTTYIWDREFVDEIENAKYLPLAVNYKKYRPEETAKYDISFVGRPLGQKRQEILTTLLKHFGAKLNIFCYEKHFEQSIEEIKEQNLLSQQELILYKRTYRGFLQTEQELANVYFNTKVNINSTIQGTSNLNYRVFEVLASRGFLLTDKTNDIENNFLISKELEIYENLDDLIDKTSFYLKNQEIAQKIALNGFSNIAKSHSYTARVYKILKEIYEN